MAAFGVDDGFADDPVRVLVLAGSEDAVTIQNAVRAVTEGLEIDTCQTLRDAETRVRAQDYDVTVLALPLPDAWIADAYAKLRENGERCETLVMLDAADDVASMKMAQHPPFAILVKSHTSPELLRRLLLSAALYKRVLDDAPDALVRSKRSRS